MNAPRLEVEQDARDRTQSGCGEVSLVIRDNADLHALGGATTAVEGGIHLLTREPEVHKGGRECGLIRHHRAVETEEANISCDRQRCAAAVQDVPAQRALDRALEGAAVAQVGVDRGSIPVDKPGRR